MRPCEHVKPDGNRCRARALPASAFCYFHDPARAEERAQSCRKGGQTRSKKAAVLPQEADAPLASVADVVGFLGTTANQVRRGQLDCKVGNCLGYLGSVLMRGIQEGELERRALPLSRPPWPHRG